MIAHNLPTLGLEEKASATRVLGSGWVAQGTEVEAFENELCEFLDIPSGHAVAVSSGSAALYLALWALDGGCKRIGLPVYACAALRNAVGLVNGECVYLDCARDTPNVHINAANEANIDILIAPSMFGIPVELPDRTHFKVIEDIAQSLGAMVSGKRIGLRGELGICSFYATKLMTTGGQGGAVIGLDKKIIDRIRDYREFDCRDDSKLRFNFQMTDLQAAIGREQLKKLPIFLTKRNQIFEIYRNAGLQMLDGSSDLIQPVRYRAILHSNKPFNIIKSLQKNGVRAIVPIEQWELLDNSEKYKNANQSTLNMVSLPIYPLLNKNDAKLIAKISKDFV